MPSSPKIPKETILDHALKILIRDGFSAVNIKALAKEIGCSTQPISWHFGNMDGLREALANKALIYANQKLTPKSEDFIAAFFQIGCSYIDIAFDEPNLFRFIFMGESEQYCRGGFGSILTDRGNAVILDGLSQYLKADKNVVGKFMQRMVIHAHGIASLVAVGVLQGTKREAYQMVFELGTDLLSMMNTDVDIEAISSKFLFSEGGIDV